MWVGLPRNAIECRVYLEFWGDISVVFGIKAHLVCQGNDEGQTQLASMLVELCSCRFSV